MIGIQYIIGLLAFVILLGFVFWVIAKNLGDDAFSNGYENEH